MRSAFLTVVFVAALASVAGCALSTVRWRGDWHPELSVTGPIFVLVAPGPALPPDRTHFSDQLLKLVREIEPNAEPVQGNQDAASRLAFQRGGRFLLVATVRRWRDAQTQYYGEPDSIALTVRLLQLQPAALIREFELEANSPRLAVRDTPADRLLGAKFRDAVRRLLSGPNP